MQTKTKSKSDRKGRINRCMGYHQINGHKRTPSGGPKKKNGKGREKRKTVSLKRPTLH